MNNDIRNLSKWLNEEQETPIDRQALARVLAMAEQPAQGCDYCNHPQYAGTKCKNCGREQPAQPLTEYQKWCMYEAGPDMPSTAAGVYMRAVDDTEAAHGIKGDA